MNIAISQMSCPKFLNVKKSKNIFVVRIIRGRIMKARIKTGDMKKGVDTRMGYRTTELSGGDNYTENGSMKHETKISDNERESAYDEDGRAR